MLLAGLKTALCFPHMFVCWFVVHPYLSHTLLPCNFNLVDLMAMALGTDVATLAPLRVLDTEEQRQHRRNAVESGNTRSEQSL